MKHLRWTIEEEKVLISQIEKNPQNIKKAFTLTSELINRSENAIRNHYYLVILKGKSKLPKSYMYFTVGKTKVIPNRKVVTNNTEIINTKISIWNRIKRFLGLQG